MAPAERTAGPGTLILFGATGDLSRRMLIPSLYALDKDSLLTEGLKIVGTARSELDDGAFRKLAAEALDEFLPAGRRERCADDAFLQRLHYLPVDVTTPEGFGELAKAVNGGGEDLSIFLSTAPQYFEPTIEGLAKAGLAEGARIGLEKPLGHDLASSREINDAVAAAFPEERTFRIDHYLGKETVQNIMALRFANMMFEPVWNAANIQHVEITVAETVGLEGRADFYDDVGALRDMVQNHMLQLLALTAMEPPTDYTPPAVRDEKVKVLRALRPVAENEMVFGQYGEGSSGGSVAGSYEDDLGQSSDTETFVALKAHVDNWRWQGVPFYMRTGKRMAERRSEIVVQFKCVPHSIFASRGGRLTANRLVIRLQPEEYIRLLVMAKEPGLDREGVTLRQVPLDLSLAEQFEERPRRIAYERLLLDLIEGDPTLFVRRDEVEAQWRWIDAVRATRQDAGVDLKRYGAGTWGPTAGIALTERDGVSWND